MPVNITQPNGQVLSVDVLGGTQSLSLGPVRDAFAVMALGMFAEGQSMRFGIGPDFVNAITATASAGGGGTDPGEGGGGDPGDGGGGGGGRLDPMSLPQSATNVIYYDTLATGGVTMDGSGVSQLNDLSGNDNHLAQASASNRPTVDADGFVVFNGVDQYMQQNLGIPMSRPFTVVCVIEELSTADGATVLDSRGSGSRIVFGASGPTTDNWGVFAGSFIDFPPATAEPPLGSYGYVSASFSSNVPWANGVAGSIGVGSTSSIDPLTLGARFDLTRFGHFRIGFLAYWDSALTSGEMIALNTALATRYGY